MQLRELEQSLAKYLLGTDLPALVKAAGALRDGGHAEFVSYSRKVFIPLTQLCRDICHYCTFSRPPKNERRAYLSLSEVMAIARRGEATLCREALFTLGDKPEMRWEAARQELASMGFASTLDYLHACCAEVLDKTGLLPHINAGIMNRTQMLRLREVSVSMGLMLESGSRRLMERGMPHYGSPDKEPSLRLATIDLAGELQIPFTTGILIGIGETRGERVDSLLSLKKLHERHGHLQEIIIQNFRAKPGTPMADAPEPDLDELLWTIAAARLIFGSEMNIQAPPNLSPGAYRSLIDAGINDWGGISPVTQDHVNPEAVWPQICALSEHTARCGKLLIERLAIYPAWAAAPSRWLSGTVEPKVLALTDARGWPRTGSWISGTAAGTPEDFDFRGGVLERQVGSLEQLKLDRLLEQCWSGKRLDLEEIVFLFNVTGPSLHHLIQSADRLRHEAVGSTVRYVVNRNINYTNVCTHKCGFCAFSKGSTAENLRGKPYNLDEHELRRRISEAWDRGATEVCMQGGIHPDYDGQTYLEILRTAKSEQPAMHVHAFSPLEVWHGATSLGMTLRQYLRLLKEAGLGTLPGTAAEILDDEVRALICPGKLSSSQWLEVAATAHEAGLRTTATIMFGHVDRPVHWARHLLAIRDLQVQTGGFTEFVPLPFIPSEAPIYLRGQARRGPSARETVLMHAVARLIMHPHMANIQVSWVKLGEHGVRACLSAGANDLGGTLMNESISRAAGGCHGQELTPADCEALIESCNKDALQRTTLYHNAPVEQRAKSYDAAPLAPLALPPVVFSNTRRKREAVQEIL